MEPSKYYKKFIFNEKIDTSYLHSLYENDYQYIEEIFGTTLDHFDNDYQAIISAYNAGDIAALKKAVHKIKPTFGFAGLLTVQEQCRQFEEICQKAAGTDEVKTQYQQIVTTLAESKELISSEHRKLKEFNSNFL